MSNFFQNAQNHGFWHFDTLKPWNSRLNDSFHIKFGTVVTWGVRTLWEAIITDKTTKLKICIPI